MAGDRYEILTALTASGLAKEVNKRLAEGWMPTGGVTYGNGGWGQAMVLPANQ